MINLKKLLTEEVQTKKPKLQENADLVRSGIEKVFLSGESEISYRRLENVGLGYIRSVNEACKCAIQESRKIANRFGYEDDKINSKFIKNDELCDCGKEGCNMCAAQDDEKKKKRKKSIKEDTNDFSKIDAQSQTGALTKISPEELSHDKIDMSNSTESREVQIGREIQKICENVKNHSINYIEANEKIYTLAEELVKMHSFVETPKINEKLDYDPEITPVPLKCKLGLHKWEEKTYMRYKNKHGWACAPFEVKVCKNCGGGKIIKQYPS